MQRRLPAQRSASWLKPISSVGLVVLVALACGQEPSFHSKETSGKKGGGVQAQGNPDAMNPDGSSSTPTEDSHADINAAVEAEVKAANGTDPSGNPQTPGSVGPDANGGKPGATDDPTAGPGDDGVPGMPGGKGPEAGGGKPDDPATPGDTTANNPPATPPGKGEDGKQTPATPPANPGTPPVLGEDQCWCAGGPIQPSYMLASEAEARACAGVEKADKRDGCARDARYGICACGGKKAGWQIDARLKHCQCIQNAAINALPRSPKWAGAPKRP